jgi:nicotinate phosphoribosyltransferase
MVTAARGRPIIEMGSRRRHEEAAVAAPARAYLAGFAYTSNLEAGRRYGVPTTGTAAHAFTLLHDDESAAFASQVAALGKQTTLLVDTYDISQGIRNAIAVAGPDLGAIRIDSGDLSVLAAQSRAAARLARRGRHQHRRLGRPRRVRDRRAGRRAGRRLRRRHRGRHRLRGAHRRLVYKLVEVEGRPVVKRSEHKATVGGRKTAVRRHKPTGTATEEIVVSQGSPRPSRTIARCSGPFVRAGRAGAGPAHAGRLARAHAAEPDLHPVGRAEALRRRPGHSGRHARSVT